jgi:hypothetical protein
MAEAEGKLIDDKAVLTAFLQGTGQRFSAGIVDAGNALEPVSTGLSK